MRIVRPFGMLIAMAALPAAAWAGVALGESLTAESSGSFPSRAAACTSATQRAQAEVAASGGQVTQTGVCVCSQDESNKRNPGGWRCTIVVYYRR